MTDPNAEASQGREEIKARWARLRDELADEFKDGMTMSMADGTPVTFSKKGEDTYIGDARILGKAKASNGVVYVIDAVVVPTGKQ